VTRRVVAVVILLALAPAACRRTALPPARAEDPRRAEVLRFWQRLHEATSLRLGGKLAPAAQGYRQALAIDPGHEDALYYLGHCERELGRPAQARDAFSRLVDVNPSSARGHLALGALLASADPREPMDLAAAERHLRRAHEINKEETGAMVRLGEILMLRGRRAEALTWLEAASRTNAKSVEAAFLAGYLHWEAGDRRTAARFYERALAATRADAPIRGVLNEGDRKPAGAGQGPAAPAPPLQSPMGRTLLGEFAAALKAAGDPDHSSSARMDSLYEALREGIRKLRREAAETPRS
jgi:tetratricopeptide (TPR) repeat protein